VQKRYLTLIGDVHGCYLTLRELLKKVPSQNNRIIFLGDLINKGKRSFEVYRFIKEEGHECVLGNHEYYCMNRKKLPTGQMWLGGGGKSTIRSIEEKLKISENKLIEAILDSMSGFFGSLPKYLFIEIPERYKLLLTHAGVSEDLYTSYKNDLPALLQMPLEKSGSYIFTRKPLAAIEGIVQVVGHRPTAYAPRVYNGNYLIDSGCVYSQNGMGYLSALVMDLDDGGTFKFYTQQNLD
jgi:serine/threonine protein phosphatase 1